MGRKAKFSQEKKLEIVTAYLEGKASSLDLSRRYGCDERTVRSIEKMVSPVRKDHPCH